MSGRIQIHITASKLLSFFIFFSSIGLSIYFKDPSVFTQGIMYASGLVATKTITNTLLRKDNNDNNN